MTEDADVLQEKQLTTDVRDPAELVAPLRDWLPGPLGADDTVTIDSVTAPSGSGLSSITLLLDVTFTRAGQPQRERLAVRIPPHESAYPVFPHYDLGRQYAVMAAVAAATDVPVPALVGVEETGDLIGSPFLVMRAVEGRAPLDNPPYVFGGWLAEATPEERAGLDDAVVDTIARIHSVPEPGGLFPERAGLTGEEALRAHVQSQRDYYAWTHATDGVRVPLIERTFAWLEENWPSPGDAVLSWGDARPGNILFDGFTPVAVLDWEMADLAPREVDLGWHVFIHRFFQDIAEVFGLPGLPDFATAERAIATYQERSGHQVDSLQWYVVYAALRHGIVMARIKRRMIHFGEEVKPEDPDDYVMHRRALEELIGDRTAP